MEDEIKRLAISVIFFSDRHALSEHEKCTFRHFVDRLLDNFSNGKLRWKVDNFPEGVTDGPARELNHSKSSLEKKLGSILTLAILKSTMASF